MKILKQTPLFLAVAATISSFGQTTFAQEERIEEIITIGSRNVRPRSAIDSPVPVDVISSEDLRSVGNAADITDSLKALVPSYTATPATGDGSAFVRPTSLRGMAPDQTLILVNGKRRHRSALVHFFAPAAGNGSHGVDVGMIPAIASGWADLYGRGAESRSSQEIPRMRLSFCARNSELGLGDSCPA